MAKAKAKPRGRPRSVMTDEVIDKILRTIELGVWPDRAAQMHGVSGASLTRPYQPASRSGLMESDSNQS